MAENFTAEERAAMKERAQEVRKSRAEMSGEDRSWPSGCRSRRALPSW